MAQVCWQCGASSEPATASESPESRPLHDVHRLLTSNDVPLDSEIPFIHDIMSDRQKQVDALEAAIAQLAHKRDQIVENIRQRRAILSPIRRVPPELTSLAFWPYMQILETLRVSVSCSLELHHLIHHSLFFFFIGPSPSHLHDRNPTCPMCRCADAPLRVCWSPSDERTTADPGSVDLVLAHSSRWRTLRLDICSESDVPVSLDWLRPANGRLLALETFEVTRSYCHTDAETRSLSQIDIPDIFSTAPSLRNVFLTDWNFQVSTSVPAIPWAQITRYSGTLRLDSEIEMIEGLEAAVNLVSCAIGFPEWAIDRGRPTVLPRLRCLDLETPEFIHRLNTPLLEELIFQYWGGTAYGVEDILPFVQRSSCMLKTLVLRRCKIDLDLITVLHGLPSLTHLVIENNNLSSTPAQIALVDTLADGLCPNLASMAFRIELSDVDTRQFFAMARSRFQLEPPSARLAQLRLFGGWGFHVEPCPPHIVVEIQAMCDEGFDVSFVDSHEEETLKGKPTFR
ncbi:hypothetical protein DFH08DRAFT_932185 [Mycena albidolilacea]|uniref:Uncharacterized protein n=1 Tax=Mycena albidolilacea TaxID=1033008 RepID=A0AAD7AIV5_9AGAR|nr:hypothetical protein DFH08DRAFT_932185 [Mycena albidolilacea]